MLGAAAQLRLELKRLMRIFVGRRLNRSLASGPAALRAGRGIGSDCVTGQSVSDTDVVAALFLTSLTLASLRAELPGLHGDTQMILGNSALLLGGIACEEQAWA